jgi:hypothetical protein
MPRVTLGRLFERVNSANRTILTADYFILALAFLRSAQYFFIRSDTALRAAADICRPRR